MKKNLEEYEELLPVNNEEIEYEEPVTGTLEEVYRNGNLVLYECTGEDAMEISLNNYQIKELFPDFTPEKGKSYIFSKDDNFYYNPF